MNVKKYTTWQKYIKNSKDKKASYKIFLYWEKIKNQNVKISINFSLNNHDLKESIKTQYVNNKVSLLLKKLNKRYNCLEFSETTRGTISFYMTPLGVNVNKVDQLISGMVISNHIAKEDISKMIIQSLPKMNGFFKIKSIEGVVNYIKKSNKNPSFRRVGDDLLVQKINTAEELKLYASPSWCTNYNDEQVEHYIKKFRTTYIWKKTKTSIEIYGVNFNKKYRYIESIFDSNNNEVYDDEMRELLILSMGDCGYISNLDGIMCAIEDNHLKTLLLLLNVASDDYLSEVIAELEYQEITLVISSLLGRSFPMKERLKKFVKIMIRTNRWEYYLLTRLKESRFFSDLVAIEVFEYINKNPKSELIKNSSFIRFLMKSISINDQYKLFNKINAKKIFDVNDSIYTLCFFDFLDNDQKKIIISKIPNYTNAEIFDVINYCGESLLDSKQLVRFLIKCNKLNLNMFSSETYEIIRNNLDLKLKIKLFKGTTNVTVGIAKMLLQDSAVPIKEITDYWIQKKRINFANANAIGHKNLNMQSINKRYSEDDFYEDLTTGQFDFRLNDLKLYYKNRYWMKSNKNYIDKILMLLKTNQLTENEFSKLITTSNENFYKKDVQVMFAIVSDGRIKISMKNKYAILNELKDKLPKKDDELVISYMIFFTKFFLVNDLLHRNEINEKEIKSYIKKEEVLNYCNDFHYNFRKVNILSYKLIDFVFKVKINKELSKEAKKDMWFLYLKTLKSKVNDSEIIKKFFLEEKRTYNKKFGNLINKFVAFFGNF